MTHAISPLHIPVLKELEAQGMNLRALLLMQKNLVANALRITTPNDPRIMDIAAGLATKGPRIYDAYAKAVVSINKKEVKELEKVAHHLQWLEGHLERKYVQAMAKDQPQAPFAEQQGMIADVYAGLIQEAEELAKDGIVAVGNSTTLAALTQRSDGPLGEIFDKAMLLIENARGERKRERAYG